MSDELRREVRRFGLDMERRLQKHDDHRGADGWVGEDDHWLLDRLCEEVDELTRELNPPYPQTRNAEKVRQEAADVANFAMMIAEVCDGR